MTTDDRIRIPVFLYRKIEEIVEQEKDGYLAGRLDICSPTVEAWILNLVVDELQKRNLPR